MANYNQQVNPRNGVDFSSIRKFTPGGTVKSTYEGSKNGDSEVGNRKNTNPKFYDEYNPTVIARWAEVAQDPNLTIDLANAFVKRNHDLYVATNYDEATENQGTKSHAKYGKDVKQYLQDYHGTYWGFGNNDQFWEKFENDYPNNSSVTTDRRNGEGTDFQGDDYFGALTNRRRANYFNDEELKAANEAVKSRGWHWELAEYDKDDNRSGVEGRHFYKLVEDGTPPRKTPPEKSTTLNWRIPDTLPEYKHDPWTDWAHILNIWGRNMGTLNKNWHLDQLKRVPLVETTPQYAKVTDNLIRNKEVESLAAEARSATNQALGSDANLNKQMQLATEKNIMQSLYTPYNQTRTLEFNQTTLHHNDISNSNKDRFVNAANQNALNLAARWNQYINDKEKYNLKKAQETDLLVLNLDKSHENWVRADRQNYEDWINRYNSYVVSQPMRQLLQELLQLELNKEDAAPYKALLEKWRNGTTDTIPGLTEGSDYDTLTLDLLRAYASKVPELAEDLEAADAQYTRLINNLMLQIRTQSDIAENALRRTLLNSSTYISGQGGVYFRPRGMTGQKVTRDLAYRFMAQNYKTGGKMTRFIDYIEHNRKILEMQDKRHENSVKTTKDIFKRDLDSLDKEILLLLRSVFK